MNVHLSLFRPYPRDAGHDDQLTRAALITMQMVPLAHDASRTWPAAAPSTSSSVRLH